VDANEDSRLIYEDVRKLLAKKDARHESGSKPAPRVQTAWRRVPKAVLFLPDHLLNRQRIYRGGTIALFFAAGMLALVYGPLRSGIPAPRVGSVAEPDVTDRSGVATRAGIPGDPDGSGKTPTETVKPPVPEPELVSTAPVPRTPERATPTGTFFVRVGSFREQANAQRLADSLRAREPSVRVEVSGDLHLVMVGPFAEKSLADDTAQVVHQAVGLIPQVLEREPRPVPR
jgi:hypothetical protein